MIIATAGHVDHGKTALLKALTGVDADRLPEEKKRGLTIDLGYVYDDAIRPGTVIGFVDVPGHERFVHNMLAGVTAIRAALLVVAADDGPMPQTREHLAILDLIGVETGIVALTKTDLVDAARTEVVKQEIAALLDGTSLQDAPVMPVSAASGAGIDTLRTALAGLADGDEAPAAGRFRMPIDRAFHVSGAGLVVTGLVESGSVRVGDRLTVSPAGWPARVRGLRAQDRPADEGRAGQRCALNLAGPDLDKAALHRGQWLVAPELKAATRRLDARIRVLPTEERPLRSGTPVHVHIGTADVTGRIGLVGTRAAEPGDTVFAHLVLDRPVNALHGDVAILRDQSARRTVGGGRILDPFAPARGHSRRAARLAALDAPDPRIALDRLLRDAPGGLDLAPLETAWNLTPDAAEALAGGDHVRCAMGGEVVGIARDHWDALQASIRDTLASWHAAHPERGGPNDAVLMRALPLRIHRVAFDAAVAALVAGGAVERQGALLAAGRACGPVAREAAEAVGAGRAGAGDGGRPAPHRVRGRRGDRRRQGRGRRPAGPGGRCRACGAGHHQPVHEAGHPAPARGGCRGRRGAVAGPALHRRRLPRLVGDRPQPHHRAARIFRPGRADPAGRRRAADPAAGGRGLRSRTGRSRGGGRAFRLARRGGAVLVRIVEEERYPVGRAGFKPVGTRRACSVGSTPTLFRHVGRAGMAP